MRRRLTITAAALLAMASAGVAIAKCYRDIVEVSGPHVVRAAGTPEDCEGTFNFTFMGVTAGMKATWHCDRGLEIIQIDSMNNCHDTDQPSNDDCDPDGGVCETDTYDGGGCTVPTWSGDSGCAERSKTPSTRPSAKSVDCRTT